MIYTHDHFNEENFYKNRISKSNDTPETLPVIREELNVGKREVEIDRNDSKKS